MISFLPLKPLGSYQIGGKGYTAAPDNLDELNQIIQGAREKNLKVNTFGWGTNLLFPDHPDKSSLFLTTRSLTAFRWTDDGFYAGAGFPLFLLALTASVIQDERFYFCYLLPGSVGGGVYINARCYEAEISGILKQAEFLNINGEPDNFQTINAEDCDFSYKKSIFQNKPWILTGGYFCLCRTPTDREKESIEHIINHWKISQPDLSELSSFYQFNTAYKNLFRELELVWPEKFDSIDQDRTLKNHFTWPSCGSVFKNDRSLGKPTGALIDELGLKNKASGGAAVSSCHGNIIINQNNATAHDVNNLINEIRTAVSKAYGHCPDVEIVIYEPMDVSEGNLRV